jgi:signal peptidase II
MNILKKLSKQRIKDATTVIAILAATIFLDQITKSWAQSNLKGHEGTDYWSGLFRFEYAENPGAFLGLGGGLSPVLRFWIFTVLVAVFLVFACVSLFKSQSDRSQQLGLALLVGGGLGNLWDRLLYQRVVDFMNMGFGSLRTGIFNVADFAIVVGICFMMFGQYLTGKKPAKA